MSAFKDLTGQRFGRLIAIKRADQKIRGHATWCCQCDCGRFSVVSSDKLVSGHTQSCGCFKSEVSSKTHTTHGCTGTRLYNIWSLMKKRCDDPKNELYGGRGISVCDEWRDFSVFKQWSQNNGYSENLTLDRKNPNGNYEPANCRWATNKEQQNNKRNNRSITFCGEPHTIAEWAEINGLPLQTLWNRLYTLNWPLERALTTPRKEDSHA